MTLGAGELAPSSQCWGWGRSRYSGLFQGAEAVGEGEPLPLGPLAHFSGHCPQGLTPEDWTRPCSLNPPSVTEK